MEINLLELWGHMGFPVKCVAFLLTIQAIGCVAVVFDRVLLLTQSGKRAREFAVVVGPSMESGNYAQVLQAMTDIRPNHLTQYLELGLRTFLMRANVGDSAERAAD